MCEKGTGDILLFASGFFFGCWYEGTLEHIYCLWACDVIDTGCIGGVFVHLLCSTDLAYCGSCMLPCPVARLIILVLAVPLLLCCGWR